MDGVRFDTRSLKSLADMLRPTKDGELQQLLCGTNLMRSSILNYSETI